MIDEFEEREEDGMDEKYDVWELGEGDVGRHIYIVSDGTGGTCNMVVSAALAQFNTTRVVLHRVPFVRTQESVEELVREVAKVGGVIAHTLVSPELRKVVLRAGTRYAVPTIDVLGPLLTRLSDLLEISPMARPGIFRQLDEHYFQRIRAIDYTVKHDDGLHPEDMQEADVILVGVSRTSKTPLSIYLSYRGWKVANVPVVMDMPLPKELFAADDRRILGLIIKPLRLREVRQDRIRGMEGEYMASYIDDERIKDELAYSSKLFRQYGWTVIDVTSKSIEEAASDVMNLIRRRVDMNRER